MILFDRCNVAIRSIFGKQRTLCLCQTLLPRGAYIACFRFRVYFELVICKCCCVTGRTDVRSRETQELAGFHRSELMPCNSGEYILLACCGHILVVKMYFFCHIFIYPDKQCATSSTAIYPASNISLELNEKSADLTSLFCVFEQNALMTFACVRLLKHKY